VRRLYDFLGVRTQAKGGSFRIGDSEREGTMNKKFTKDLWGKKIGKANQNCSFGGIKQGQGDGAEKHPVLGISGGVLRV